MEFRVVLKKKKIMNQVVSPAITASCKYSSIRTCKYFVNGMKTLHFLCSESSLQCTV